MTKQGTAYQGRDQRERTRARRDERTSPVPAAIRIVASASEHSATRRWPEATANEASEPREETASAVVMPANRSKVRAARISAIARAPWPDAGRRASRSRTVAGSRTVKP